MSEPCRIVGRDHYPPDGGVITIGAGACPACGLDDREATRRTLRESQGIGYGPRATTAADVQAYVETGVLPGADVTPDGHVSRDAVLPTPEDADE